VYYAIILATTPTTMSPMLLARRKSARILEEVNLLSGWTEEHEPASSSDAPHQLLWLMPNDLFGRVLLL
jgi:hypothetical protein